MNLFTEPWLPVRLRSGAVEWVQPAELARGDVLAFAANRADFNGALLQFAIALLQTCFAPRSQVAWNKSFRQPPSPDELQAAFAPVQAAFLWEGDGPRFMQDRELPSLVDAKSAVSIDGLLIDAPGDNAQANNTDHFVKRGGVQQLCPHCAASALLTLQINAPSGGAGHRTGVRGGGPLTTLVLPEASTPEQQEAFSLWHTLWLNVRVRSDASEALPSDTLNLDDAATLTAWQRLFPWIGPQSVLQSGESVSPVALHPHHVLWAMPRRIRLDLQHTASGVCDVCLRSHDACIRQYRTQNYGLNYKGGWSHPLSPYYRHKAEWLPIHPQPSGLRYQHWLDWTLGRGDDRPDSAEAAVRPAAVLGAFDAQRALQHGLHLRLWAFGYDMDNAKARCWVEATLPLYALLSCSSEDRTLVHNDVRSWLDAASDAASQLRRAVKHALQGSHASGGDFSFVDDRFWSCTESAFYRLLRERLITAQAQERADIDGNALQWLRVVQKAAREVFAECVEMGQIERQKPAQVSVAYHGLQKALGSNRLRVLLKLPEPQADAPKTKGGRKKTASKPREAQPSTDLNGMQDGMQDETNQAQPDMTLSTGENP